MRNRKNHPRRLSAVIGGTLALGMLAFAGPASANHSFGGHQPIPPSPLPSSVSVAVPTVKSTTVCIDEDDDPATPDRCVPIGVQGGTFIVQVEGSLKTAALPQPTVRNCPTGQEGRQVSISALGTGIDYLRVTVYKRQNGGRPQQVAQPVNLGPQLGTRRTVNVSLCSNLTEEN